MEFKYLLSKIKSFFFKKSKPSPTIIKIMIGDKVVGAIESLSIVEKRNEHPIVTTGRVRFDRLRVAEAFSRGFVQKVAQQLPFQIKIEDNSWITTLQNVWIDKDIPFVYTAGDWIIIDTMTLVAELIKSIKR